MSTSWSLLWPEAVWNWHWSFTMLCLTVPKLCLAFWNYLYQTIIFTSLDHGLCLVVTAMPRVVSTISAILNLTISKSFLNCFVVLVTAKAVSDFLIWHCIRSTTFVHDLSLFSQQSPVKFKDFDGNLPRWHRLSEPRHAHFLVATHHWFWLSRGELSLNGKGASWLIVSAKPNPDAIYQREGIFFRVGSPRRSHQKIGVSVFAQISTKIFEFHRWGVTFEKNTKVKDKYGAPNAVLILLLSYQNDCTQ